MPQTNVRLKAGTQGRTERHTATVPPPSSAPSAWLIGVGAAILIGLMVLGYVTAGTTATPLPRTYAEETPEPPAVPATQDTQHAEQQRADDGAVNVNGDHNTVTIDNRVTNNHYHAPEVTPPRTQPEAHLADIRLVRQQVKPKPTPVKPHCNREMAEHHRRVASWYDQLADE